MLPPRGRGVTRLGVGASQADVAVLVVDCKAGLEPQTREHAVLARYLGVRQVVVAINKMDLVGFSQDTFEAAKGEVVSFLTSHGYEGGKIRFVPISGLEGLNLTRPLPAEVCSWYAQGPTLLQAIDTFELTKRPTHKPLRVSVQDVFKAPRAGVTVCGRIEAGTLTLYDDLLICPSGESCRVGRIVSGELEVTRARAGETVTVGLGDIDPQGVGLGSVLCPPDAPVPVTKWLRARVCTLDMMQLPLIPGSQVEMHLQSANVPATIRRIIEANGKRKPRCVARGMMADLELSLGEPVCAEVYEDCRPFGRFLLRSRGVTCAAGCVTAVRAPE